jgi:dihydroorotate dehydrogenase (NAD+) catalytic subunit
MKTAVPIAGLTLKNPVMTASGTCGYGLELAPFYDLSRLGALVVKGISVLPRPGNPPPRVVETCGGMLNAIGLQNVGMEAFIREVLPALRPYRTPLIVNILGESEEEYATLAETLGSQEGVHGLEVNVSCPNVQKGGISFGADPDALERLVRALRKRTDRPLLIKLSPNVTDIVDMAVRAEAAGADGLTLINTLRAMAIDLKSRRPCLATVVGGLSGPAIKPIALRMVWEVSRRVRIPVVGVGGILCAEDALEFLVCGATAVQVGTAHFRNPSACIEVIEGIEAYLAKNRIEDIQELIGSLKVEEGRSS